MSLPEVVIAALLVLWLAVSLAAQLPLPRVAKAIRKFDGLGIIPAWSFFAPRPGTSDFRLLFRDRMVDGRFSGWREVTLGPTTPLRMLWNPGKRREKAVFDLVQDLLKEAEQLEDRRSLQVSLAYLALLDFVARQPRGTASEARMFAVAVTQRHHTDAAHDLAFVSWVHGFDRSGREPMAVTS